MSPATAASGAREVTAPALLARLAEVLAPVAEVNSEYDDALTVSHDGTVASIRVVAIADNLEMVSLTQMLAWDLPVTPELHQRVAEQTAATLLGTVTLVARPADGTDDPDAAGIGDVLLRYNFPAAGLDDEALRTLILMVLAGGVDVRAALS